VFCVNLLAAGQQALAEHFSGKVRDRQFDDLSFRADRTGAPVLEGTLGHFDCEVIHEHQVGSHAIFIGRVLACEGRAGRPLGYFEGGFHDFAIEGVRT
jgi:flavin reductase (DIM6/NTAB) family NADH-FMN oxidoreductase RutF